MPAAARPVTDAARRALTAQATTTGPRVTITTQIKPDAWRDVKAVLEAAGATYVTGTSAFEFPPGRDAAAEVARVLAAGEIWAASAAAGYVATPAGLADGIARCDAALHSGPLRILEPSAGTGRLVAAVLEHRQCAVEVVAVESDPRRAAEIPTGGDREAQEVTVVVGTFEGYAASGPGLFDRVVMNPPFSVPGSAMLWAEHLLLAWTLVAPGGRLIAITPASATRQSPARVLARQVADLIRDHGDTVEALEPDTFAESGAAIKAVILTFDRPPAPSFDPSYPARTPRPITTRAAATTTPVQVWCDNWHGDDRVLRYRGDCWGCGGQTWAHDDGENDPRGALGDRTGYTITAEERDQATGPTAPPVVICSVCHDTGETFNRVVDRAHEVWAKAAAAASRVEPAPLPEPREERAGAWEQETLA